MNLEKLISSFVETHYNPAFPVLLALSGGPDSLALFHLLKDYSAKKKFNFAVAHVDHGWREESEREATALKKLAEGAGVVYHEKKLDPELICGNLEEACRNERLSFFKKLTIENGYQAVIMGHHADDQVETVLKRILEGSYLSQLGGMSLVSNHNGLEIWRPFIQIKKSEILKWLEQFNYKPFMDKTNLDSRFLRGRFRTTIIPDLKANFGKEVSPSLLKLSLESLELKDYLDFQVKKYFSDLRSGPFGSFVDLSKKRPDFDIELKHLLKVYLNKEKKTISHKQLLELCQWIKTKKANAFLTGSIYVDRGRLFILSQNDKLKLDHWNVCYEKVSAYKKRQSTWKDAWEGNLSVILPDGNYSLGLADARMSDWWTNEKVPAILRWLFPVVYKEDNIVHEFLTGRNYINFSRNDDNFVHIKLTYTP